MQKDWIYRNWNAVHTGESTKVILISGHARNGKDTVANMIRTRLTADGKEVLLTHFADALKFACREFFGWDGAKDDNGRVLLQYVGTDIVRGSFPDFWVDFICKILISFRNYWDYVVIPDTRFPNEIEVMRNCFNVTHVGVERANFDNHLSAVQRFHPSETSLDNCIPDYLIHNDKGLPALRAKVDRFVEEKIYGSKAQAQ